MSMTAVQSTAALVNGNEGDGGGETGGFEGRGVTPRKISRGGEERAGTVAPTRPDLQACHDLMLEFTGTHLFNVCFV